MSLLPAVGVTFNVAIGVKITVILVVVNEVAVTVAKRHTIRSIILTCLCGIVINRNVVDTGVLKHPALWSNRLSLTSHFEAKRLPFWVEPEASMRVTRAYPIFPL